MKPASAAFASSNAPEEVLFKGASGVVCRTDCADESCWTEVIGEDSDCSGATCNSSLSRVVGLSDVGSDHGNNTISPTIIHHVIFVVVLIHCRSCRAVQALKYESNLYKTLAFCRPGRLSMGPRAWKLQCWGPKLKIVSNENTTKTQHPKI